MKKTALEKRIKKKIIAKEHTFFASCAPGLKKLLVSEINNLNLESKKIVLKQGGVEFFGKVHDCYLANLYLRCPIRILMRITAFKAENFSTLEEKIAKYDWELLLQKSAKITFHVSTKKSRLYHTSAIAQRAEKIISTKLLTNGTNKISPDTKENVFHDIFIRAENDRFEISLDSSGELLHKRGIKENTSPAPLRENLAWAVLFFTQFSKNDVLIDPMCGSGTFSLEASLFKQNIPPGFFRDFAFQSWKCFRQEKWNYLKKQAQNQIKLSSQKEIFASDIDNKSIQAFKKNIQNQNFDNNIEIQETDFFSIIPEKLTPKKGVLVLNPPYGKRIGNKQTVDSFYNEIGKKLEQDFKGWRVGIIMPEKHLLKKYNFQTSSIKTFYHGGLDIFLLTCIV